MTGARVERVKFVFLGNSIAGVQTLDLVVRALTEMGLQAEFSMRGAKVETADLYRIILKRKSWPSGLVSNGLGFQFGVLPALDQIFMLVEQEEVLSRVSLDELATHICGIEGLVQAWISDVEYDFWQNAKDILEYESAGRDFSMLPKKSNGLPAPLEQIEIDVSDNLGRSEFKHGYIEAIGSTMWVGAPFWEKVGKAKETSLMFLKKFGFKIFEINDVSKIVSTSTFIDDSTAYEQETLRRVFFGDGPNRSRVLPGVF